MNILYIGEPKTYNLYKEGKVPSHWLYGAVEMEKDNHHVIWEKERSFLRNDLQLIKKYQPDIIFIPNLNIRNHFLLLFFTALKILNIPIYGYLHREPTGNKKTLSLYKFLFKGVRHLFFLSELSMKHTIEKGILKKEKCSLPGWGPDMNFYSYVKTSKGEWFVSTGKENRDFDILIKAFKETGAPLHIMTAVSHAGNDYSDLKEKCKGIPNIKVTIMENSPVSFQEMLSEMAKAKALVCPIQKDKLSYCVGLSTITDAEGLRKPLIITYNPYHGYLKNTNFILVESLQEWIKGIEKINKNLLNPYSSTTKNSISLAYYEMKKRMFF